jgi:hypothetical protein
MGAIFEDLRISYPVKEEISTDRIDAFIEECVVSEINRINSDPEMLSAVIKDEKAKRLTDYCCFFNLEEACSEYEDEEIGISDLLSYSLEGGRLSFEADTENSTSYITRYLAWKLFCEFGINDSFVSYSHYQDRFDRWTSRVIVDRSGCARYEE